MIQHAPQLESVETIAGPEQAPIMQELIQSQHAHLKRLGMRASLSRSEDEKQLIQHHMRLGKQSNLREMKIYIPYQFVHDSWLALVPRLTQLVTLEFYTAQKYDGFKSLSPLMAKLAYGCPALEQLIMTCKNRIIGLGHLYPMDRHRNLKRIVVNCSEVRGDASTFCQRFTNIESFHLSLCRYRLEDINTLQKGSFKFLFREKLSSIPYYHTDSLR